MKHIIHVNTRLQDNGDGGYTLRVYPSEDALIEDHPAYDNGKITPERRDEILNENDPYEDGYIGTDYIIIEVDENGIPSLKENLSFHAGQ